MGTRGKRMLAAALTQCDDSPASKRLAPPRGSPMTPPDKIRKPARSPPKLRRWNRLCFASTSP